MDPDPARPPEALTRRWTPEMPAAPNPSAMREMGEAPAADPCDVCGGPTFERHCKVICRRCGYTRDCSDP